jgi:hypothetical protein
MRNVVIIGTSHKYQTGTGHFDSDCESELLLFRNLLENTCLTYGVCAVAEELHQDNLPEERAESTVCEFANTAGLAHVYAEPSSEHRRNNGMPTHAELELEAQLTNIDRRNIPRLEQQSMMSRELYWLTKLLEFNQWPLLFVCGANHVNSFSARLRAHDIAVQVAVVDWDAANP